MQKLQVIIFTLMLLPLYVTHGLRILGIFHTSAKSHFFIGDALMKGLAEAGHDITAISMFPLSKNFTNFQHIDIGEATEQIQDTQNYLDKYEVGLFTNFIRFFTKGVETTNATLYHPAVQHFLALKDEHFDVVITEIFASEALIGFGHHFKAPVIVVSTFGTMKFFNDLVGTPSSLSYVPHPFLSFTDHMDLPQRIINTIAILFEHLYMEFIHLPQQYKIYDKVFSNPKPSLAELRKNVSLALINTHFSIGFPRPYVQNMIEIGGIQIRRRRSPLPSDVKEVLDSATNGAIYFSLGSHIKSTLLPQDKRNSLLKVFAKLNQTVLWKWEDTNLIGKSDNVFVKKWYPQDDVLAHPNVKCFITHGGLLSTSEAVYHGVPIIGIPVFAEQHLNMAKAQAHGYAVLLSYSNLTEVSIQWAIMEVLKDSRYTERAKTVSKRYRDQPMTPLETAIYWVEYIARHDGAPHLKSASMELNYFSYHSLDVFAILGIVVGLLIVVSFKILSLLGILYKKLFSPKRRGMKTNNFKKEKQIGKQHRS